MKKKVVVSAMPACPMSLSALTAQFVAGFLLLQVERDCCNNAFGGECGLEKTCLIW
jgi:hypothetical protein